MISAHTIEGTVGTTAKVIYKCGYEAGADSWATTGTGKTSTVVTTDKHSGTHSLAVASSTSSGTATTARTMTGLIIGHRYTLAAWIKSGTTYPTALSMTVGISGKGNSGSAYGAANWYQISYTFTATATSHVLQLLTGFYSATTVWWDDITFTDLDAPYDLSIIDAEVGIDEGWAPYSQVKLTCYTPDDETLLDSIDPLTDIRVLLDLDRTGSVPSSRPFNLGLRSREVDYNTGTMTLELASDEALLQDYALLNTATERTYGISVKAAVEYALAKIDASLQPGAADANLESKELEPTLTNLVTAPGMEASTVGVVTTNLVKNPRALNNTTGWAVGGGTLSRIAIGGPNATCPSFARLTMTSTTSANVFQPDSTTTGIVAGLTYTTSCWLRASATLSINLDTLAFNSGGSVVTDGPNTTVSLSAGSWTRVTNTWVAGGSAVSAAARVLTASGTLASGQTLDCTGLMITEGSTTPDYFDGDVVATTETTFAWVSTAHASSSTRTVIAPAGYTALNSVLTRTTVRQHSGTYSQRVDMLAGAADTTGTSITHTIGTGGILAATQYTLSAWAYVPAGGPELRLRAVGAGVASTPVVSTAEATKDAWVRLTVTFTTAASGAITLYLNNAATLSSSASVWTDSWMLNPGSTATGYFSGGTADESLYDYAWTGTANASTSTKTNLPNSDATIWEPGVTAWDYVSPLVQATGLKLLCDGQRRWFLIEGNLNVDGVTTIAAGVNVKTGRDSTSRNSSPRDPSSSWYLGVVIRYVWTDDEGIQQTAYDLAGLPQKVLQLTYERPYPGPGAAANVLARAAGRGRVYDLTAISSYDVEPGKQLVATLPDASSQVGVVSAVTWRFPEDTMTVASRGLIETPATSWLFADEGLRWMDVPVGTDWTEYTP